MYNILNNQKDMLNLIDEKLNLDVWQNIDRFNYEKENS